MIFVTVGTQKFQLNRLLASIDGLVEKGIIEDTVFAQTGNSTYAPKHYQSQRFLNRDEFLKIIKSCNLLITHSGVGTIIEGLNFGKPVIVFPRRKEYGEHVDDHQLQIAEAFEKKNYILVCREEDQLEKVIKSSEKKIFEKYVSGQKAVVERIEKFLETIED
ncbi:PssE/Cps14G family polysaccharide biosynthesis glycosyltransferase [Murimonas intestini]|uniref:PssE/Cps14G family polysaccharide biosynthesis glycosyltransferase n=1 Tax=Murimonas intestini TaxID=1337051 RepID=UPI0011DD6BF4|nr:PssE/Cps14G family polysaccharide biosynthesis glycosyltransferase [Murimonas intestini]